MVDAKSVLSLKIYLFFFKALPVCIEVSLSEKLSQG